MPRTLLTTLAALLVALAVAWTPTAQSHAQSPSLDDAPPVMHGIALHEGRHTVQPQFGITLNDEYERNLMAGISWRYYLASSIGIGVDVWGGGGVDSQLTEDINRELSRPERPFELSTSTLRLLANAAVELVPFVGKAMVFGDSMVRIDLHINAGVGMALASGNGRIENEVSVTPMFGVGIRVFPNEWLAVGIDLRDYLVNRVLASRRDGSVPGAEFNHNWLFGISVGFFFPTKPEIVK